MTYQSWIILFVSVVAFSFFIFINGGFRKSFEEAYAVFKSPAAASLLFFSVLLFILIMFGGAVVREGWTIRDILIFSAG